MPREVDRNPTAALVLAPLLAVAIGLSGCASPHYAARSLPNELRATPGGGMQRVRLGGFAMAHPSSKSIGVDDLLTVHVATGLAGELPIENQSRVARDGSIEIPLVGRVAVAGLEAGAAADQIAAAAVARGVFVAPQVSVDVTAPATNRVTVLGAVGEPGLKELPRGGSDVLNAIAAAGGLTDEAGAVVELLRSQPLSLAEAPAAPAAEGVQQASFDAPQGPSLAGRPQAELIDLAAPDATSPDRLELSDRDVIIVRPKQQRVIHVTGLVKNPNQFELMEEHDVRVLDAIAMAGGVGSVVADKVLVVRQLPDRPEPVVVRVSISRAKTDGSENLILQSGDLVSVESTVATSALDTFKNLMRVTMGVGGNLTLF